MAKSNASGLLTSLDSLFTTQEQRDAAKRDVVLDLPLDQIGDFPNHPFKVRQDDAMMEMMESVQLHGVLVPGLVRQLADGSYQMVSGHRRKLASRLAGLNTLPCIVRDLTDDEAITLASVRSRVSELYGFASGCLTVDAIHARYAALIDARERRAA